MRILVIEDEAAMRRTIRRMLESAGHEVIEAEDGSRGLAQFHKRPVDAVITDIIMPNKEGIETIREIRGLDPDITIVAISEGRKSPQCRFSAHRSEAWRDDDLGKTISQRRSHRMPRSACRSGEENDGMIG